MGIFDGVYRFREWKFMKWMMRRGNRAGLLVDTKLGWTEKMEERGDSEP